MQVIEDVSGSVSVGIEILLSSHDSRGNVILSGGLCRLHLNLNRLPLGVAAVKDAHEAQNQQQCEHDPDGDVTSVSEIRAQHVLALRGIDQV